MKAVTKEILCTKIDIRKRQMFKKLQKRSVYELLEACSALFFKQLRHTSA